MTSPIMPIILSGGSGSRLWPLSRKNLPKQFLPLAGKKTMLQDTIERVSDIPSIEKPIIVCNKEHRFLVAEQMQSIDQQLGSIILEPAGRDTAPAVAVAALQALKLIEDPVLLVLPADHVIRDTKKFQKAIYDGLYYAEKGDLVTFGIIPKTAETGFGYIKKGERLLNKKGYQVNKFIEKPNGKTAQIYLESGDYLWNSGMFLFKANDYLEALKKNESDMVDACRNAFNQAITDLDFIRLHEHSFEASTAKSIDYAVMERASNATVIPLDAGWSDVGSWSSLWDAHEKDLNGNVEIGETLQHDTKNSFIYSSGRLVTTVGVKNHVIVETADAVLVADMNHSQNVKEIVKQLNNNSCARSISHRKIFRPWGNYDSIDQGHRFQVKRIIVNPGAALSLQMHHHRAEHWVVVKGTAKVTKGDEVFLLEENQSTYIPLGTMHRLENPGSIPLEIIEIQSGSYLGEDDIVRFEDIYGRSDES